MDIKQLHNQLKLSKKALKEFHSQNEMVNNIIKSAQKNAPEKDKGKIEEANLFFKQAVNLSKNGKYDEAQELIKKFKENASKNSK